MSSLEEMTIVVLIPALNAADVLPRQLHALDSQTDLHFRVVMCDNGSTDETRAVCSSWQPRFQLLSVVDASQRRGVACARNAGIGATEEPLILICDADDRVHPGWVAAMRDGLTGADAVTGPLHLVYPGKNTPTETWNAQRLPVSMGFRQYAPGGNLGIRRSALDQVGVFDEALDLGQEDVDLGWRLVAAGRTLRHHPDAAIDYFQRSGLKPLLRQQFRYGRAHVALYEKHRNVAPPPASWRSSARWFWHWFRQLPGEARRSSLDQALGRAAFQVGRLVECAQRRTSAPLA